LDGWIVEDMREEGRENQGGNTHLCSCVVRVFLPLFACVCGFLRLVLRVLVFSRLGLRVFLVLILASATVGLGADLLESFFESRLALLYLGDDLFPGLAGGFHLDELGVIRSGEGVRFIFALFGDRRGLFRGSGGGWLRGGGCRHGWSRVGWSRVGWSKVGWSRVG
jgi:hypothetical protein